SDLHPAPPPSGGASGERRSQYWNVDVSGAPLDPRSSNFISFIAQSNERLHADLGPEVSPGSTEIYGFPYLVVNGSQPKRKVRFEYPNESDGVDHSTRESHPFYPIPTV